MKCISYNRKDGSRETCLICRTPQGTHLKIIKKSGGEMRFLTPDAEELRELQRVISSKEYDESTIELEKKNLRKLMDAIGGQRRK
ncbi:hypothetical protein DRN67_01635 [Candidatus Micrarchaeota archaeon]|nr:MAG: hypothetical protein DRN67_01635 [Candidatus Micrarchaeota archaeon]